MTFYKVFLSTICITVTDTHLKVKWQDLICSLSFSNGQRVVGSTEPDLLKRRGKRGSINTPPRSCFWFLGMLLTDTPDWKRGKGKTAQRAFWGSESRAPVPCSLLRHSDFGLQLFFSDANVLSRGKLLCICNSFVSSILKIWRHWPMLGGSKFSPLFLAERLQISAVGWTPRTLLPHLPCAPQWPWLLLGAEHGAVEVFCFLLLLQISGYIWLLGCRAFSMRR